MYRLVKLTKYKHSDILEHILIRLKEISKSEYNRGGQTKASGATCGPINSINWPSQYFLQKPN